jgi:hypothetical protein
MAHQSARFSTLSAHRLRPRLFRLAPAVWIGKTHDRRAQC